MGRQEGGVLAPRALRLPARRTPGLSALRKTRRWGTGVGLRRGACWPAAPAWHPCLPCQRRGRSGEPARFNQAGKTPLPASGTWRRLARHQLRELAC